MRSKDVRDSLVGTLGLDLVGPGPDDAAFQREVLPAQPSVWYLAGFLAPNGSAGGLDLEGELDASEAPVAPGDKDDEGETETAPARPPPFPSSFGVSVLLRPEATDLEVRVTFGTYGHSVVEPHGGAADGAAPRKQWTRTPHDQTLSFPVGDKPSRYVVEDSGGVYVQVVPQSVPKDESGLLPDNTRFVTVFVVNGRNPVPKPDQDRGFIFQTRLELRCDDGFVGRCNPRGARPRDDLDERIADLQYRDVFQFAVGHGVSVEAVDAIGDGEFAYVQQVASSWLPTADVHKVGPAKVQPVQLEMAALAGLPDGASVRSALGRLVPAYRDWIAGQRRARIPPGVRQKVRADTAKTLLDAAERLADRIEEGIRLLETDPVCLEAFKLANKAMDAQSRQRSKVRSGGAPASAPPTWYPFQLAFLLMNLAGQTDPRHADRETVDLIFFPTGGGKTEAYLGLAAFTLVLRRLCHKGDASAGVAVLMRYTLRLLTLDQLERASALICALELERRAAPERLGNRRFSIGLWVGKAATPNRFGAKGDGKDDTARSRVLKFKSRQGGESPLPLERCPWCGKEFGKDTFNLLPDENVPDQLRLLCTDPRCPFRFQPEAPGGIPVVGVDEEIYRELPCFLIATVDKFAGLPWVGESGTLLGRSVTHQDGKGFYGPAGKPPGARRLDAPLLPPDLIIQDELHLISGPLGSMTGLYETVLDALSARKDGDHTIRPKIVASTATVRAARAQIQALFARRTVDVFPPPGPDRRDSFFAKEIPPATDPGRRYVGIAAPGRSQKVSMMRTAIALLGAAQKASETDLAAADPYLTLVAYFNTLRELGGARRIFEEEVRDRVMRVARTRRRVQPPASAFSNRTVEYDCVELTSRESIDRIKTAKARLAYSFVGASKDRKPIDVALASNMISVGVDIPRLGLMLVNGQPKATAEYIQATSRVGRTAGGPGLVVTLLNVHKPRDRSHFEHFEHYHASFYRAVEASSVTPFSPRALDRGLAAITVALARLGLPALTPAAAAAALDAHRTELSFVADAIADRLLAHRPGSAGRENPTDAAARLRSRVEALLDRWGKVARDQTMPIALTYQPFEGPSGRRPLLRAPLDPDLPNLNFDEVQFVAGRSMRDVEGASDVYMLDLRQVRKFKGSAA